MDYNRLNYPGYKAIPGLIQKIINQIPVFTDFYELYAGTAAVSKQLSVLEHSPSRYFINDLDPGLKDVYDYAGHGIASSVPAVDIIKSLKSIPAGTVPFVFLDPPYLHSCRAGSTHLYNFEMTVPDHVELLSSVQDLNCNCMIIHPDCDLYNEMLHGWRTVQVKIRYHSKTSVENLYMNYPEPELLQTYAYVGINCWDRQRIKRKGDRLLQKLLSLPENERNYILDRLHELSR